MYFIPGSVWTERNPGPSLKSLAFELKSELPFAAPHPSRYHSPSCSQKASSGAAEICDHGERCAARRGTPQDGGMERQPCACGAIGESRPAAPATQRLLPLGLRWQITHHCKTRSFIQKKPSPNPMRGDRAVMALPAAPRANPCRADSRRGRTMPQVSSGERPQSRPKLSLCQALAPRSSPGLVLPCRGRAAPLAPCRPRSTHRVSTAAHQAPEEGCRAVTYEDNER